jgi:hypothetical protein
VCCFGFLLAAYTFIQRIVSIHVCSLFDLMLMLMVWNAFRGEFYTDSIRRIPKTITESTEGDKSAR